MGQGARGEEGPRGEEEQTSPGQQPVVEAPPQKGSRSRGDGIVRSHSAWCGVVVVRVFPRLKADYLLATCPNPSGA